MEHELNEAYQKIKTRTKELEMINEHLDSFAYSVSHDLRAPLRAISGFSQVLLDTQGDKVNEEMRHYLDRISEGAKKMGQLIDDLLGFSRATRSEIKFEKITVEDIVNDLVKAYRDVEPGRDIEFIVNPLGEVEADKEMIKVVFSNLLQNAVKFTSDRKKARIEIGSEQKEDHIQFYIKDNGIGFDMRYKDKLFKAFQRLHTDEKFTGTGIGLTTVKRIISKHGGDIWAKGEVDTGAEFCFTLPSKTHVKD
jgi:light-regulated signal transduction histidine kinase (bacteriophytochrome)